MEHNHQNVLGGSKFCEKPKMPPEKSKSVQHESLGVLALTYDPSNFLFLALITQLSPSLLIRLKKLGHIEHVPLMKKSDYDLIL